MIKNLITVYITNYNYGRYLKQAIESVLNQTYKKFELIIIDDGSTDESKKTIDLFKNQPNVKIIYQHNKGLAISNNIALEQANGEYIIRLDADDFFDRNALKILVNEFDSPKVGVVFGDWYNTNEHGDIVSIERRHDFNEEVKLFDQPAHGACTMFRVKHLRKIKGYDNSLRRQDGYEIWFRILKICKVKNINVPIFYYRKHGESITDDETRLLKTRAEVLKKTALNYNQNLNGVAILPVRGSQLDRRSRPFFKIKDQSLIDIAIKNFMNSSFIKKIVVSTPDRELISYIEKKYKSSKILALKRPRRLSFVGVDLKRTIEYVNSQIDFKSKYEIFIVHSIEAPFITTQYIESAINTYKIFDVDCVIAVREDDSYYFKHQGKGMVPINYSESLLKYEKEKYYVATTGFLLRKTDSFFENQKMLGSSIGHVVLDKKASFFIKDDLDEKIANVI